MIENCSYLTLPGFCGSEPEHWQSLWEREFVNFKRVEQKDWFNPDLKEWLEVLEIAVKKERKPIVLVAHSLACSLVAHFAKENRDIAGAFLVAPADVDDLTNMPKELHNFAPMPLEKLPFPSMVVSSSNDPYIKIERAEYFASMWGSDFVNIGEKGHINKESKLASWEEGKEIFLEFLSTLS